MTCRVLSEMTLLTQDNNTAITTNSSRSGCHKKWNRTNTILNINPHLVDNSGGTASNILNFLTSPLPRYAALYYVGNFDLYDGLQTSMQVFVGFATDRYSKVALMQLILLILAVVLSIAYLVFVLRPYLALQRDELAKVAGLVSHVPQVRRKFEEVGHKSMCPRINSLSGTAALSGLLPTSVLGFMLRP